MSGTHTYASAIIPVPDDAIRVMPGPLREMVVAMLRRLNLPDRDAARIAECLVQVDLRGIVTHGTRRLRSYVDQYRAGALNPTPDIHTIRDEPLMTLLNGDGGIGYLAATRATEQVIDKADARGLAAAATRYHGHAGSLGIYARMALERSLVTVAVAGGRDWALTGTDTTVWDAMKSPPMCIGVPSAVGPPFVLDMSVNFFRNRDTLDEAMRRFPEAVVKSLGLKFAATLLGGILAGSMANADSTGTYAAATRGILIIALKPDLFGEPEHFRSEVARILTICRSMPPMAGQDSAETPGSLEWRRERAWVEEGIPIAPAHRRQLEALAADLGVPTAW